MDEMTIFEATVFLLERSIGTFFPRIQKYAPEQAYHAQVLGLKSKVSLPKWFVIQKAKVSSNSCEVSLLFFLSLLGSTGWNFKIREGTAKLIWKCPRERLV